MSLSMAKTIRAICDTLLANFNFHADGSRMYHGGMLSWTAAIHGEAIQNGQSWIRGKPSQLQ
jgi:hypothetical protein